MVFILLFIIIFQAPPVFSRHGEKRMGILGIYSHAGPAWEPGYTIPHNLAHRLYIASFGLGLVIECLTLLLASSKMHRRTQISIHYSLEITMMVIMQAKCICRHALVIYQYLKCMCGKLD